MNTVIIYTKILILYKEATSYKLLLLTRADHKPTDNYDDLPGGKMEAGESVVECALREIIEETGISLKKIYAINTRNWQKKEGSRHQENLFCATVTDQKVVLDPQEHSSLRWINFNEIEDSNLHPKIKETIGKKHLEILQLIE